MTGKSLKEAIDAKFDEWQRIKKKVNESVNFYCHLGQGTVYDPKDCDSILKLIDSLIKRDYPKLYDFDGSEPLQIFIPEIWLNKSPQVPGAKELKEIRLVFEENKKGMSIKVWIS